MIHGRGKGEVSNGVVKGKTMGDEEQRLAQLSDLRRRAEQKAGQDVDALRDQSATKTHELIYELQVHQIELEMQNEELRRAQLELEGLRRKYFDLFDLAPVGYFTFDEKGLIVEVNLTGAGLLGTTKGNLLKKGFSHWIAPGYQDTFYLHQKESIGTGVRQSCELKLKKSDGSEFFGQLVSTAELDDQGNFKQLRTTVVDITERKKAERERLEYQERLKAMASRLSRVQELERRKLSMRLHDSISQSLAVARLSLQQSAQSITDGALAAKLDEVSTEIRRIMEDSYSLMLELSNPILYELGLVVALKALLESRFLQDQGIKCKLRACEERLSLSRDTKVTLYQAIRELLVNSAKHGKAENIEVLIEKDADCLRIRVKDDGVGFEASEVGLPDATGGFGLFNLKESLNGIGGVLKIESKAGRGTVTEITVPVKCESRV